MEAEPDFTKYRQLAAEYDFITLAQELPFDTINPITVLSSYENEVFLFLLESANTDKTFARFSFFGNVAHHFFQCIGDKLLVDGKIQEVENPYTALFTEFGGIGKKKLAPNPLFDGFQGGLVGALAYDSINYMGILRHKVSGIQGQSNMNFIEVRDFFVFDNYTHKIFAATVLEQPPKPYEVDAEREYQDIYSRGMATLESLEAKLRQQLLSSPRVLEASKNEEPATFKSAVEEAQFKQSIGDITREISSGEAIQVVFSRGQESRTGSPLDFYRYLRRINPSPYMFFLKWQDETLTGASPEIHLRLRNKVATIKPLAGTRPITGPVEPIIADLLSDEKELAEHLMLIDLARNDLYTSCEASSVKIIKQFEAELYSHVIHISSEVQGRLKEAIQPHELLAKSFPAGTLSGAPKVRAIELIEQYESKARGFYSGCLGYFNYDGNFDTAITIRSAFFKNARAYIQAGCGLVYDSKPSYEFQESERKIMAVKEAINLTTKQSQDKLAE